MPRVSTLTHSAFALFDISMLMNVSYLCDSTILVAKPPLAANHLRRKLRKSQTSKFKRQDIAIFRR